MVNDRIWTLLTRKLSGEASATELEELSHLLSDQQKVEESVHNLSKWWGADEQPDEDFLEATYLQHIERMKTKGISFADDEATAKPAPVKDSSRKILRTIRNLTICAIAVAAGIAGWIFLAPEISLFAENKNTDMPTRVVAQHGARTKVLLPDGSNVWLNGGSKMEYHKSFANGNREVFLTGEAFFDVVKNPVKPFIIHTSKMHIRVLGTSLNVKAYENDATTETSLIRGSVEVFLKNYPSEKYLLKPNEKLVFRNNTVPAVESSREKPNFKESAAIEIKELTYIQGSQVDVETSWIKNILSFEDESFLDVAHKMERWYNVSFEFKNKKWQQEYLSGSFEHETLEQAMAALKYSNGFEYSIAGSNVTIY